MSVRAMKAGAVDFLTKPYRDQDLLDAIQHAVDQQRTSRERRTEITILRERHSSLTPREREVFGLVVRGLLKKQIAAELGASEKTIKIHGGQVMRKMQADSLADLKGTGQKLG
jgi:FixJ family two-component response regulator